MFCLSQPCVTCPTCSHMPIYWPKGLLSLIWPEYLLPYVWGVSRMTFTELHMCLIFFFMQWLVFWPRLHKGGPLDRHSSLCCGTLQLLQSYLGPLGYLFDQCPLCLVHEFCCPLLQVWCGSIFFSFNKGFNGLIHNLYFLQGTLRRRGSYLVSVHCWKSWYTGVIVITVW